MRKRALFLIVILAVFLGGCAPAQTERTSSFFAMDTAMTLRVFGGDKELLSRIAADAAELEARISVTREDSEISQINQNGGGSVSPETKALLERGLSLCEEMNGALDLTIYPIVRAWGFTTGEYRHPDDETLRTLLPAVDYRAIRLEGNSVTLPEGGAIDLGSVAKGWFADRAAAYLKESGVASAILDLGGNIQTVGAKPDGSPWRIAVRAPQGSGNLGILEVMDEAVVTSGGYERYFEDEQGNLWWHIMDPATGYPARSGVISATVVGTEGVRCDALSTALFVMGTEQAVSYWKEHMDFEMLLVTESGELVITPSLNERFTQDGGAGLRLRVIEDA
ncbi:MAG: FAD:protein FMN transferase [Oscillospiraceae bacterium]|nr:FAD:protein FMN transferase [Oscillospiraceae bacterium]